MVRFHDGLNARSLHAFCKGCTTLPCCREKCEVSIINLKIFIYRYSKFCNRPLSVINELSIGMDTSYRCSDRTSFKQHQTTIFLSISRIYVIKKKCFLYDKSWWPMDCQGSATCHLRSFHGGWLGAAGGEQEYHASDAGAPAGCKVWHMGGATTGGMTALRTCEKGMLGIYIYITYICIYIYMYVIFTYTY